MGVGEHSLKNNLMASEQRKDINRDEVLEKPSYQDERVERSWWRVTFGDGGSVTLQNGNPI